MADDKERIKELEKQLSEMQEKYRRQYASWLSLRELYNKTIRDYELPEVRMIMAKHHDKQRINHGNR